MISKNVLTGGQSIDETWLQASRWLDDDRMVLEQ
jgi:hypothetical protein